MFSSNPISKLRIASPVSKKNIEWKNPKDSIGYKIGTIGKKYLCWEAIGPARELFEKLGPEIKNYLESYADPVSLDVIWSIYMIGRSEEASAPKVIFSCSDVTARKKVRKVVEESAILLGYPGIGLEDSPVPPDLLNPKPLAMDNIPSAYGLGPMVMGPTEPRFAANSSLLGIPENASGRAYPHIPPVASTHTPSPLFSDAAPAGSSVSAGLLDRFSGVPLFEDAGTNGEHEKTVLISPSGCSISARLLIRSSEGGLQSLRPATAGGRIYIKDKSYYWTVAHAFENSMTAAIRDQGLCSLDDCDFDGRSDSEDDSHDDNDIENKDHEITSRGGLTPDNGCLDGDPFFNSSLSDLSDSPTQTAPTTHSKRSRPDSQDPRAANRNSPLVSENHELLETPYAAPNTFKVTGKVILTSKGGPRPPLDYALIKESSDNIYFPDSISLNANEPIVRSLLPNKVSRIESKDLDIVTATSSSGVLSGKLSATPSYMRLANGEVYQEVYTVTVNGVISNGDCGSWVIDSKTGGLYGHIVAGNPGTGMAYIVPATQVIEDLQARLGEHVSLQRSKRSAKSSSSMSRPDLHIPFTASAHTPSFICSEGTLTEPSVSTGMTNDFFGMSLPEEIDGVLGRRPNYQHPMCECAFWFLSCSYVTYDQNEWRTHYLGHFGGEEPPKLVQCPLCEDFKTTYDNGREAWDARMNHIASYHHMQGHTLQMSRPDFYLFQHLGRNA